MARIAIFSPQSQPALGGKSSRLLRKKLYEEEAVFLGSSVGGPQVIFVVDQDVQRVSVQREFNEEGPDAIIKCKGSPLTPKN